MASEKTLQFIPVGGILRPINFIYDIVQKTTGISLIQIKKRQFIEKSQKVVQMTDSKIFGDQTEFINAVKLFVEAPDQSIMSASGIILFNDMVDRLLTVRQNCIEYIQNNQNIILNVSFLFLVFWAKKNLLFIYSKFCIMLGFTIYEFDQRPIHCQYFQFYPFSS